MPPESTANTSNCTTRMCPTQAGDMRPLITHMVPRELCSKRQREFYHRCHRCLYRGKEMDFVAPEETAQRNGTSFTSSVATAPLQMGAEE